jgi:uncharacterized repeat protein (TIGR03943 family)
MTRVWSADRLAVAATLAVWAALFWFIMISDRLSFFLASRTYWLATVGAVALTVATAGRLVTARTTHREPLRPSRMRDLAILVVPALVIALVPPTTLGSFAVGRRSAGIQGAYTSSIATDIGTGDLSLVDVFRLTYNGELDRLSARAGSVASFTGFVSQAHGARAGEFVLNRFMVSCCPGDAVAVRVRVVGGPPGGLKADRWVRVTGRIYPIGQELVVDASEVTEVARPDRPYLNSN